MTTETVKTEVQPTPNEAYAVAEMRFMCASQIVIRSTGEVVEITPVMKLVYIYMKNQFIGFSRDKQQFYTDQRQMAAALGVSRDTFSKVLAALKKLGIVETAGWKGNSESYTVHFFNDVADNLQVIHKEWKGVPAWDHERANKNFKSKNQKPTNEEKKGNGESDQGDAEQPDGVPPVGVPVDVDLSGCDDPSLSDLVEPDSLRGTDAMKAEQAAYTSEQLHTKLRKWRNWGLDDEARAFCLSQGVNDDTDSMALFIQRYQMPVLNQIPGEIPQWDEKIPF